LNSYPQVPTSPPTEKREATGTPGVPLLRKACANSSGNLKHLVAITESKLSKKIVAGFKKTNLNQQSNKCLFAGF